MNSQERMYGVLGYPLVVDLKTIIKMNAIQENTVTESDLKLMECLFGPAVPTIKGKPQDDIHTS